MRYPDMKHRLLLLLCVASLCGCNKQDSDTQTDGRVYINVNTAIETDTDLSKAILDPNENGTPKADLTVFLRQLYDSDVTYEMAKYNGVIKASQGSVTFESGGQPILPKDQPICYTLTTHDGKGTIDGSVDILQSDAVSPNYPDPFAPTVNVAFELKHKLAQVELQIRAANNTVAAAYGNLVDASIESHNEYFYIQGSINFDGSRTIADLGFYNGDTKAVSTSISTTAKIFGRSLVIPWLNNGSQRSKIKLKFSKQATTLTDYTLESPVTLEVGKRSIIKILISDKITLTTSIAPWSYSTSPLPEQPVMFSAVINAKADGKPIFAPIPAASNIVVDGPNTAGFTVDNSDNEFSRSGVYFKYGSLIGLSASSTHDNSLPTNANLIEVFRPQEYKGTITDLQSIPYLKLSNDFVLPFSAQVQKSMSFPRVYHDPAKGIGDICKYIDEKFGYGQGWRLPTAAEFEYLFPIMYSSGSFASQSIINAQGHQIMSSSRKIPYRSTPWSEYEVVFPMSGYRSGTRGSEGKVAVQGREGRYMTGSRGTSGPDLGAWSAWLSSDTPRLNVSMNDAAEATLVRCVREDPNYIAN